MLNIHKNTFLYRVEGIGLYHEPRSFRSLENAIICMLDFMAKGYNKVEFGTIQISNYLETYTPIQSFFCLDKQDLARENKFAHENCQFEFWVQFGRFGYMPTMGHDEMTDEFYYKSVKKA